MGILHNLADLIKIKKDKMTILVLRLDNSGKSSIINHFKKSSDQRSIVQGTVGLMVKQFSIKWLWNYLRINSVCIFPFGAFFGRLKYKHIYSYSWLVTRSSHVRPSIRLFLQLSIQLCKLVLKQFCRHRITGHKLKAW